MLHKCHDFSANAEFLLFPKRANSAERGLSMPSSKVLAFGRGDASSAKEPAANILHTLWHFFVFGLEAIQSVEKLFPSPFMYVSVRSTPKGSLPISSLWTALHAPEADHMVIH